MKTYNTICKELETLKSTIDNALGTIETLNLYDEIRKAYREGNKELLETLKRQQEENDKQIIELSEKAYINKVILLFLEDNKKVALYEHCKQAIKNALAKYDKKSFGEKTKEKVKNEIFENTTCYVWFENGGQYGNDKIHIRHKEDYYNDVVVMTSYENKLFTADNKINVSALDTVYMYEKYSDKPKQDAKKLIALHNKALQEVEKAEKALSEYSHFAPTKINVNTYIANKPYKNIVTL